MSQNKLANIPPMQASLTFGHLRKVVGVKHKLYTTLNGKTVYVELGAVMESKDSERFGLLAHDATKNENHVEFVSMDEYLKRGETRSLVFSVTTYVYGETRAAMFQEGELAAQVVASKSQTYYVANLANKPVYFAKSKDGFRQVTQTTLHSADSLTAKVLLGLIKHVFTYANGLSELDKRAPFVNGKMSDYGAWLYTNKPNDKAFSKIEPKTLEAQYQTWRKASGLPVIASTPTPAIP
jgi:hypothetical protein